MYDVGMDYTRKDLYDLVWTEPLRTLAKRFGFSDVGLKKLCKRHDIPTPGLGYWAKVQHGQDVRKVPLPPAATRKSEVVLTMTAEDVAGRKVARDRPVEQWLARERLPQFQIAAPTPGVWGHPLSIETERALRRTKPQAGWLVPPPGCLALRVSAALLPRALAIMDAIVAACEARGWPVTTQFQMPRRLGWNDTFWYPGSGWLSTLPQQAKPLTGVGLLKNYVWFSIREISRMGPPTADEIRAHRRKFPWGGTPSPRPEPNGVLLLELDRFPRVHARHRFKDLARGAIETQLNDVMIAIINMADGIRADQLEEALDRRTEKRALRRKAAHERSRQILQADVRRLRTGVQRWRWRVMALEFLEGARQEAGRRGIADEDFERWLAWAESYVEQLGWDEFFRGGEVRPE